MSVRFVVGMTSLSSVIIDRVAGENGDNTFGSVRVCACVRVCVSVRLSVGALLFEPFDL